MPRIHSERCPECKQSVKNLLAACFGDVKVNWDLNIPSRIEDYRQSPLADRLEPIHHVLQQHRGFDSFVKRIRLPRVDYFIPNNGLIVEFDESQHFTQPREIALSHYPTDLKVGFSVGKWQSLCQNLNKKDNTPPYRDEQRAWYDTVRDFAPEILEAGQIIRLYSREMVWCSLYPGKEDDLLTFRMLLQEKMEGHK